MPEEESKHDHYEEHPPVDPLEASTKRASSPAPPGLGNRPAEGARQVTPGEVLSEDFLGSETAGDFLGIDVEVAADDRSEPSAELELASAPSVSTETRPEEYDEEGALLNHDELEGVDPFGETASADERLSDLDPGDEDSQRSRPNRLVVMTAGAFLVGLIIVVGVVFGPGFLGGDGAEGTSPPARTDHVARAPSDAPVAPMTDPTDPVGESMPDAVDPTATSDPASDPVEDPVVAEDVPETPVDPPNPIADPVADVDPPVLPELDLGALGLELDPGGGPRGPGEQVSGASLAELPPGTVLDESFLAGLEWAGTDQLEMIWRSPEPTMSALDAPVKVLMPRVGDVRVIMTSGKSFEGKLVAMGQQRVWIDSNLGRMGLEGSRVDRIERLASEPVGPGEIVEVARGDLVRVKALGGVLYGRVITKKGSQVILVTDGGGRVTLTDPEVEPVGSSRAIVVDQ